MIMGDESVAWIDHYDEYYVNLLFDRSIYRLMWVRLKVNANCTTYQNVAQTCREK